MTDGSSAIVVRAAQPGDEGEVLRLIHALALYERAPEAVEATEAMLAEALFSAGAQVHCHLAELDGVVVGMALWFLNYSTWTGRPGLYLEDLFIDEAARSRGAARALFTALAQEALARGCARIDWSVLDWNELAMGFYRRIGAEPTTGWQRWRLEGDAIAHLALAPDSR